MPELKGSTAQRTARLHVGPAKADGQRTFTAALSSEEVVKQLFGLELLDHDRQSIDLSRASEGLPLLFSHDRTQPIGRVQNIQLDTGERKLRGDLLFSPHNPLAQRIEREVEDGFLGDVSISYDIDDYRLDDTGEREVFRITQWKPTEVSIVSVPADASVGVGRSKEMPGKAQEPGGKPDNVIPLDVNAERERVTEIENLFISVNRSGPEFDRARRELISSGANIEHAQRTLLTMLAGDAPDPVDTRRPNDFGRDPFVSQGPDSIDKFLDGATRALEFRAGLLPGSAETRAEMCGNEFAGHTLAELAREAVRHTGIRVTGLGRDQLVAAALKPDAYGGRGLYAGGRRDLVGHSTSVFTNLLENIANKALLKGYDETPETWSTWCRVGNLADFKQASRAGLSQFDDLDEIPENAEYKHGSFDDRKEPIQLATYGKLFAVTRQAIVNDDLDGMSSVPRKMGRAAARKIGDLAYGVLTSNPTLNQDNQVLFHADHNNLGTTGTPSVTTVSEARQLMVLQKDQNNQAAGLNIRMAFLIVPVALEDSARVLLASQYDPIGLSGAVGGALRPNPVYETAVVVADPRLDADNDSRWYAAADPNVTDTVEIAFLNGMTQPYLESRDGWTTDGVEYKIRLDAAAAALDFRGLVRNAGN